MPYREGDIVYRVKSPHMGKRGKIIRADNDGLVCIQFDSGGTWWCHPMTIVLENYYNEEDFSIEA